MKLLRSCWTALQIALAEWEFRNALWRQLRGEEQSVFVYPTTAERLLRMKRAAARMDGPTLEAGLVILVQKCKP